MTRQQVLNWWLSANPWVWFATGFVGTFLVAGIAWAVFA
jgi:ABC-type phosphate transport system auxiliary subunit